MNYILLPAYNEEKALPEMLRALSAPEFHDYTVIVVDDGSTDGTAHAAASSPIGNKLIFLQHGQNKGLGQTMATGFSYLQTRMQDEDTLTTLDADNTHPVSDIPEMVSAIRGGCDIVIRSRFVPGAAEHGVPPHRRLFSRGASWLLRTTTRIPGVKDYSCGFRAYSGKLLREAWTRYGDALIEENGFACMFELLYKLSLLHPIIKELPLQLRYDLKPGPSKLPTLPTMRRYFALLKKWKSV